MFLIVAGGFELQKFGFDAKPPQAAASNENETKKVRAYVFIDTAEVLFDGAKSNAILNFKNFGTTPAYDVVGWIKTSVVNPADPIVLNPMPRVDVGNRDSKVTVGPQGTFRLSQAADFNEIMPKEEVATLIARLKKEKAFSLPAVTLCTEMRSTGGGRLRSNSEPSAKVIYGLSKQPATATVNANFHSQRYDAFLCGR